MIRGDIPCYPHVDATEVMAAFLHYTLEILQTAYDYRLPVQYQRFVPDGFQRIAGLECCTI